MRTIVSSISSFATYCTIVGIKSIPFSLKITCKKLVMQLCKLCILTRRKISSAVSSVEFFEVREQIIHKAGE